MKYGAVTYRGVRGDRARRVSRVQARKQERQAARDELAEQLEDTVELEQPIVSFEEIPVNKIRNNPVLYVALADAVLVAYIDPTLRFALQKRKGNEFVFEDISSAQALAQISDCDQKDVLVLMNATWIFEAGEFIHHEGSFRDRLFSKYEDALAYAESLNRDDPYGEVYISPRPLY